MEESGRRESFAPTYGVHINPVSKGKQIPLCSSGQGCTHEGGPFQRPPIDCTDLNYRTLKKSLFSIHHPTSQPVHSGTKWQNPPNQKFVKLIDPLYLTNFFDMKCMEWPETEVMCIYWKTRQKFGKLAYPPYVLQQFDDFFGYEVHAMTGNGSFVNLLNLARKSLWKHIRLYI